MVRYAGNLLKDFNEYFYPASMQQFVALASLFT
jgi:hypothetical protein